MPWRADARASGRESPWLQDRASWRDLHGGDSARVQDEKPVAVSAPKHAAIAREGGDSVLDNFVIIGRSGLLIGDIEVVTARQPDPQHNARHLRSLGARLRR